MYQYVNLTQHLLFPSNKDDGIEGAEGHTRGFKRSALGHGLHTQGCAHPHWQVKHKCSALVGYRHQNTAVVGWPRHSCHCPSHIQDDQRSSENGMSVLAEGQAWLKITLPVGKREGNLLGVLEPHFDGPVKGTGEEDLGVMNVPRQVTHQRGVCWIVEQGVAHTHHGALKHCPRVQAKEHDALASISHCQACNHTSPMRFTKIVVKTWG